MKTELRPTPETDAAFRDGYTFCREDMRPAVEFCANLERQQDEAREQLESMREAIKESYDALFRMVSSCRRYLEEKPCSIHDGYDENYISPLSQSESALAKLQPFLKP